MHEVSPDALPDALPAALTATVRRLAARFSGRFGFWARDLRSGETVAWHGADRFPSASTIKVFVLRELHRQAEAGLVDLDRDQVELRQSDIAAGSGVIKDLTPGLRLSLRDAATLMVTVSDNTATNLLVERLGTRAINQGARSAGYPGSRCSGRIFKGRGLHSHTTPQDLGVFMARVAGGRELSRTASRAMLDTLKREQYANIVGRLIPYDPYGKGRDRWLLASKSGSLVGVRNDAAYVRGPGVRYAIALMSRDCADERFNVDNEANLVLARLAAAVHDHFGGR
jgi:beta-lactamase class A